MLKLNEDYVIDTDQFNIILYQVKTVQKGERAGEKVNKVIGYYGSVGAVLRAIYHLEVVGQGVSDLAALNRHVEAVIGCCVLSLGDMDRMHKFIHGNQVEEEKVD